MAKISIRNNNHIDLINEGVDLFNLGEFKQAFPYFEKAYKLETLCPSAIYNLANCYFFLKQERETIHLLEKLLATDDLKLKMGCPDRVENPRQYKLDALFLLFKAKLFHTNYWADAYPYATQHLNLRRKGLKSAFTLKEVNIWIKYYYNIYHKK